MIGEKLLNPSQYGSEEYLVLFLMAFIIFVAVKHLIFHTFYFWWYCNGQFYFPNKFWTIVTGKSLGERVIGFVKNEKDEGKSSGDAINDVVFAMNEYFQTEEFAPSLGEVKGKILDSAVRNCMPDTVLVIGCHVGYCLLRILHCISREATVIVVEKNRDHLTACKQLVSMVGFGDKITFLCAEPMTVVPSFHTDYGIDKFDFVFLNRVLPDEPSHLPLLKLLEGDTNQVKGGFFHQSGKSSGENVKRTVLLADKVVMPGDPEFLKYVRLSNRYETKYHQMSLEYSPHEILDGMEVVTFVG